MAVYVDPLFEATRFPIQRAGWKYTHACHMIADTRDELEAFARLIRLRRDWFHGGHYNLTSNKQREAIRRGAVLLGKSDFVRKWREIRARGEA
jgi:hypothetical protein